MDNQSLSVIAAVNDDTVLRNNLALSPLLSDGRIELIVERKRPSAAAAYNAAMSRTDSEILIFAHQDVYLPSGWEENVFKTVDASGSKRVNWAVLGVYGVEPSGRHIGRAWSSGLGRSWVSAFLSQRRWFQSMR